MIDGKPAPRSSDNRIRVYILNMYWICFLLLRVIYYDDRKNCFFLKNMKLLYLLRNVYLNMLVSDIKNYIKVKFGDCSIIKQQWWLARWQGGKQEATRCTRLAIQWVWNGRNIQIAPPAPAPIKCCFIANSQIRLWPINDPLE